jgi:iron transport multicopper oxidase
MTPDLCISSALARLSVTPATIYAYVGIEYGRECYTGSVAPTPEPMSLAGTKMCTMTCAGDRNRRCGGPNRYNLWVATSATIMGTASSQRASAPAVSTVA